jgi:hypothetical protein
MAATGTGFTYDQCFVFPAERGCTPSGVWLRVAGPLQRDKAINLYDHHEGPEPCRIASGILREFMLAHLQLGKLTENGDPTDVSLRNNNT